MNTSQSIFPMTDQHPLTDEMCENIAPMAQWAGDIGDIVFHHCDMRAAADWQLEQVLKWITNCRDYDLFYIKDRALMRRELKKAMRPTTTTTTETP